jgi:FAD/FMN-containing dehydrogenase
LTTQPAHSILVGNWYFPHTGQGSHRSTKLQISDGGAFDRRPAVIARCTGAADVIACVRFARQHDLLVSVRGGGHSIAGKAVCDGGLMIDLSLMKGIRVDPRRKTARAETGIKLGEFDRETQAFGLATTQGVVPTVSMAGLTLGGGWGHLHGKYGLAIDNVIGADVVTADGRLLTANDCENQDLFWGIRGGSDNFGVVTSLEFRLHEIGPLFGGETAFPHRQFSRNLLLWSMWESPSDTEKNIQWTRECYEIMRPFLAGGAYGNYVTDAGEAIAREAYGPNYDRLVSLKNKYDPTNFFRMNHNIKPAAARAA